MSNRSLSSEPAARRNVTILPETDEVLAFVGSAEGTTEYGNRARGIRRLARLYAQLQTLLTPEGMVFIHQLMEEE